MHRQATGLKPENDYDLSRKVEFMKRIRNTQIANKIIKSNRFKDYTRYSLQACFARALELEGDFQVGRSSDSEIMYKLKCWLRKGKRPLI